jgi:hypothetical protein
MHVVIKNGQKKQKRRKKKREYMYTFISEIVLSSLHSDYLLENNNKKPHMHTKE